MPSVAIQGIEGSFHAEAAHLYFSETENGYDGEPLELLPCQTFRDVYVAVDSGATDFGVAAVENLVDGTIPQVHRLAAKYPRVRAIGKRALRVDQFLVGSEAMDITALNRPDVTVETHPVAFGQTSIFMEEVLSRIRRRETDDTAASIKEIVEAGDPLRIAIGGLHAAELYGGVLLREEPINDRPDNTTDFRFLQKDAKPAADANETSIDVTVSNQPGVFKNIGAAFADNGLNIGFVPYIYRLADGSDRFSFNFDFNAGIHADEAQAALHALTLHGFTWRINGSWKSGGLLNPNKS